MMMNRSGRISMLLEAARVMEEAERLLHVHIKEEAVETEEDTSKGEAWENTAALTEVVTALEDPAADDEAQDIELGPVRLARPVTAYAISAAIEEARAAEQQPAAQPTTPTEHNTQQHNNNNKEGPEQASKEPEPDCPVRPEPSPVSKEPSISNDIENDHEETSAEEADLEKESSENNVIEYTVEVTIENQTDELLSDEEKLIYEDDIEEPQEIPTEVHSEAGNPYICEICKDKFETKMELIEHVVIHIHMDGEDKYIDDVTTVDKDENRTSIEIEEEKIDIVENEVKDNSDVLPSIEHDLAIIMQSMDQDEDKTEVEVVSNSVHDIEIMLTENEDKDDIEVTTSTEQTEDVSSTVEVPPIANTVEVLPSIEHDLAIIMQSMEQDEDKTEVEIVSNTEHDIEIMLTEGNDSEAPSTDTVKVSPSANEILPSIEDVTLIRQSVEDEEKDVEIVPGTEDDKEDIQTVPSMEDKDDVDMPADKHDGIVETDRLKDIVEVMPIVEPDDKPEIIDLDKYVENLLVRIEVEVNRLEHVKQESNSLHTFVPRDCFVRLERCDISRYIRTRRKPAKIPPAPPETNHKDAAHQHPNTYNCDTCGRSYKQKSHLRRHVKMHLKKFKKPRKRKDVPQPPFICTTCNKEFTRLYSLQMHERIHTGVKPYTCEYCKKQFSVIGNYEIHKRVHTGVRPYSCKLCEKTFTQVGHLRTHQRSHTGEKPYSCEICNKRFTRSTQLKTHIRIHTGEKPYSCQTCHRQFKEMGTLKMHIRIHTGEKPYSCDVCKKDFSQSSALNVHKRIHTGERPYGCETCLKRFSDLSTLKAHKRIHTGEKPHICKMCNKAFTQLANLRMHEWRNSCTRTIPS